MALNHPPVGLRHFHPPAAGLFAGSPQACLRFESDRPSSPIIVCYETDDAWIERDCLEPVGLAGTFWCEGCSDEVDRLYQSTSFPQRHARCVRCWKDMVVHDIGWRHTHGGDEGLEWLRSPKPRPVDEHEGH
jgi:hypothetical protein